MGVSSKLQWNNVRPNFSGSTQMSNVANNMYLRGSDALTNAIQGGLDRHEKTRLDNERKMTDANTAEIIQAIRNGKKPKKEGLYNATAIADAEYEYRKYQQDLAFKRAAEARANARLNLSRSKANGTASIPNFDEFFGSILDTKQEPKKEPADVVTAVVEKNKQKQAGGKTNSASTGSRSTTALDKVVERKQKPADMSVGKVVPVSALDNLVDPEGPDVPKKKPIDVEARDALFRAKLNAEKKAAEERAAKKFAGQTPSGNNMYDFYNGSNDIEGPILDKAIEEQKNRDFRRKLGNPQPTSGYPEVTDIRKPTDIVAEQIAKEKMLNSDTEYIPQDPYEKSPVDMVHGMPVDQFNTLDESGSDLLRAKAEEARRKAYVESLDPALKTPMKQVVDPESVQRDFYVKPGTIDTQEELAAQQAQREAEDAAYVDPENIPGTPEYIKKQTELAKKKIFKIQMENQAKERERAAEKQMKTEEKEATQAEKEAKREANATEEAKAVVEPGVSTKEAQGEAETKPTIDVGKPTKEDASTVKAANANQVIVQNLKKRAELIGKQIEKKNGKMPVYVQAVKKYGNEIMKETESYAAKRKALFDGRRRAVDAIKKHYTGKARTAAMKDMGYAFKSQLAAVKEEYNTNVKTIKEVYRKPLELLEDDHKLMMKEKNAAREGKAEAAKQIAKNKALEEAGYTINKGNGSGGKYSGSGKNMTYNIPKETDDILDSNEGVMHSNIQVALKKAGLERYNKQYDKYIRQWFPKSGGFFRSITPVADAPDNWKEAGNQLEEFLKYEAGASPDQIKKAKEELISLIKAKK